MTENKIESIQLEVSSITMARKARKYSSGKDLFTGYLTLENDKQDQLIKAFGLKVYTSQEDNNNFIVVKVADRVVSWSGSEQTVLDTRFDGGVGYSIEGYTKVNIIKGSKDDNVFYRLTDIMPAEGTTITKNERRNPFA